MKMASAQGRATLKMALAQVVETSVANNSPSPHSSHPDDQGMKIYAIVSGKRRTNRIRQRNDLQPRKMTSSSCMAPVSERILPDLRRFGYPGAGVRFSKLPVI